MSNRAIAAALLGLMFLGALCSLVFGLKTVPSRRARDPRSPFGYLPPGTNIVAAIRLDQALQEVSGRQFASGIPCGPQDSLSGWLRRRLNLKLDDLTRIVVGVDADSWPPAHPITILETGSPHRLADFQQTPGSLVPAQRGNKEVLELPGETGFKVLWLPAERFLVLASRPQDLDPVPLQPWPGAEQLSPRLQHIIEERTDARSQAWAAGEVHDPQRIRLGSVFGRLLPHNLVISLNRAPEWAISLRFDEVMSLAVAWQAASAQEAVELRADTNRMIPAETARPRKSVDRWVTWREVLPAKELLNVFRSLSAPAWY